MCSAAEQRNRCGSRVNRLQARIRVSAVRTGWSRLQTFAKRVQTFIEARRVVPERCVPRLRQMNLRVRHRRLVLIDGGRFDNRICDAMCNQHRLADLRQEVVVAVMPPDVWTKITLPSLVRDAYPW